MSRCFPFPPPGYEKKAVTDVVDLLKKEKHREKKHKKEKRDKEKKESKEKREKEGRDGKHKEKKDKKEKHREKKKDKDKDRDKDKNKHNTADEKAFPGQAEGPNGGKVNEKELKQKDKKDILSEEKFTKHYVGNNGDKARENNLLAEESKDFKFVKELGRRIRDEDAGVGNQLVQKLDIAGRKKDEGTVRLVGKGSGTWPDVKERLDDKTIDARKFDGQGFRVESRPSGNTTAQNHAGNFHPRVDGMPGPLEKNFDRSTEATVEGQEKVKEKKADDKGGGKKKKGKDKEKKGHGKDKDREKEKKKEDKAKEPTEHKNSDQNKLKGSNKGGLVGTNSFAQIPRESHKTAVSGENLKKRKDIESNGVLHANDHWPSKLPRPSSLSHPFTENGRAMEPCQISIPHVSEGPAGSGKLKVDNKDRKINGIIEAQPSTVSINKTNTVTVPVDSLSGETPAKPPHLDSKYLSRVYSVPKMEWSDFDDQEWLFGNSSQEKKPMTESSEVGETLQVWAEALHIEPADVCALPYVIPY